VSAARDGRLVIRDEPGDPHRRLWSHARDDPEADRFSRPPWVPAPGSTEFSGARILAMAMCEIAGLSPAQFTAAVSGPACQANAGGR
jgi:hypothetical protein